METIPDVIIIGAGISGVAVAYTLHKLKRSFIILESRDRIGGRMHTTSLQGATIHLGACYIHDPNQSNAIVRVMKELGIQGKPNNYGNQQYLKEDGIQLSPSTVQEGKNITANLMDFISKRQKTAGEDVSLQVVTNNFLQQCKEGKQDAKDLAKFIMKFTAMFQASDLKHHSLKQFSHDRTEDDMIPPGGYFSILQKIYDACKPVTFLNQKVISIDYSKKILVVTTSNGMIYKAKTVISSLPLGVLKKKIVNFYPPLPLSHSRAIDNITCGIMNKIYLKFKQDFWTQKGDWIFLYTDQDLSFNIVVNEAETSKNVMCVKVGGFQNSAIFEKSDPDIIADVLTYLGKYYNKETMELEGYYITRWHKDQHTYGSYCSFKHGESRSSIYDLRKSIEGKIWFVGEHCCPDKVAFAHGAFESGERAAVEVSARLANQQIKGRL